MKVMELYGLLRQLDPEEQVWVCVAGSMKPVKSLLKTADMKAVITDGTQPGRGRQRPRKKPGGGKTFGAN